MSSQNATALSGAWEARHVVPECMSQEGYPKVHCKYALNKRGCRSPKLWKSRAVIKQIRRQADTTEQAT